MVAVGVPEKQSFRLAEGCLWTVLTAVLALSTLIAACSSRRFQDQEILIGLENDAIPLLIDLGEPDPLNTGIVSLDALNRHWHVQRMVPLFPETSSDDEIAARYGLTGIYKLIVPKDTDLNAMIKEYGADSNIRYAELNKAVEVK